MSRDDEIVKRWALGARQRFRGQLRRQKRNVVLCHTPTRATAVAAAVAAPVVAAAARPNILIV